MLELSLSSLKAGLIGSLGVGRSLAALAVKKKKKSFKVNSILFSHSSSPSQESEPGSLPPKSFALTLDIAPVEIMDLMQKLLGEVFWPELHGMTRLDEH